MTLDYSKEYSLNSISVTQKPKCVKSKYPSPPCKMMNLPCSCNDSGKHIFRTIANHEGQSPPLDEILLLHQKILLLGPGIRQCLVCCTNDDTMKALLDGLATLCILYEAVRIRYSEANASEDATRDASVQIYPTAHPFPRNSAAQGEKTSKEAIRYHVHPTTISVPHALPLVVLGRLELTDSERNLVAVALIKQGLSQTGSHLRDLQQHLASCLMDRKMKSSNYDVYKRRVGEILNGIYSSLACI